LLDLLILWKTVELLFQTWTLFISDLLNCEYMFPIPQPTRYNSNVITGFANFFHYILVTMGNIGEQFGASASSHNHGHF